MCAVVWGLNAERVLVLVYNGSRFYPFSLTPRHVLLDDDVQLYIASVSAVIVYSV